MARARVRIFALACAFGLLGCAQNNPVAKMKQSPPPPNVLAPSIGAVSDTLTPHATAKVIPFTVTDGDTFIGCGHHVSVQSSNYAVTPVTSFSLSGAAPNCALTITPPSGVSGTVTISLTVNDGNTSASTSFDLTVLAPLALSGTPVSTGLVSSAYAGFSATATGGLAPYTYSVASGSLPTGVTFSSTTGAVSGTPSVAGAFTVTLRVTDDLGQTASLAPFTLYVASYRWDFASAASLDGSITYVRGGGATRMGMTGLVEKLGFHSPRFEYHPISNALQGLLIEEGQANLLQLTERFDTSYWAKMRASVTRDSGTAPDGTTTADKLVEDATMADTHFTMLGTPITKASSSEPYTLSVYAKAVERSAITLRLAGTDTANRVETTCHLTGMGSTASTSAQGTGWSGARAAVTRLANGWYRCSLSGLSDASTDLQAALGLHNSTTDSYDGDGASGALLWGAQLEKLGQMTSYIPAANLLRYSEEIDQAGDWVPNGNATATADSANAPDGLAASADLIDDNDGASTGSLRQLVSGVPDDDTMYLFSAYVRSTGASAKPLALYLHFDTGGSAVSYSIAVDASNCTYSQFSDGNTMPAAASVDNVTGGGASWCRVSLWGANNASGNTDMELRIYPAVADTLAGTGLGVTTTASDASTGSHVIWGAQVEAVGSAAQPASPYSKRTTAGSLAERSADSVEVSTLGAWFQATQGTVVAEARLPVVPGPSVFPAPLSFTNGTQANRITPQFSSTGASIDLWTGGMQQTPASVSLAPSGALKLATAYAGNDLHVALNNNLGTASTSASVPAVNRLLLGQRGNGLGFLNGVLGRVTYFPSRVSNTVLQSLSQ